MALGWRTFERCRKGNFGYASLQSRARGLLLSSGCGALCAFLSMFRFAPRCHRARGSEAPSSCEKLSLALIADQSCVKGGCSEAGLGLTLLSSLWTTARKMKATLGARCGWGDSERRQKGNEASKRLARWLLVAGIQQQRDDLSAPCSQQRSARPLTSWRLPQPIPISMVDNCQRQADEECSRVLQATRAGTPFLLQRFGGRATACRRPKVGLVIS